MSILDQFRIEAEGIPKLWRSYESGIYGSDIICGDDTDALFSEDDGTTPAAVAYSAWRTITSETDSIPDAPGEGLDIRMFARRPATRVETQMWPSIVAAELLRDDRIADVKVVFSKVGRDEWEISIDGVTSNNEPFDLVGLLSPSTTILKEIMS